MNRKKYIILFFLLCTMLTACADKTNTVSDISELIPNGWNIIEKAEGDLNEDGISDIAVVIEETNESEEGAPSRELIIAFGNKDGKYTFSTKAENAILKSDEGGIWGDPFEGISIDKGSISIDFYGGSNWRWYGKYRFKYQDNGWYLIGATVGSLNTSVNDSLEDIDYNLLTGEYIEKKSDENGNIQTTKGKKEVKSLLKLEDFIATDGEENIK